MRTKLPVHFFWFTSFSHQEGSGPELVKSWIRIRIILSRIRTTGTGNVLVLLAVFHGFSGKDLVCLPVFVPPGFQTADEEMEEGLERSLVTIRGSSLPRYAIPGLSLNTGTVVLT